MIFLLFYQSYMDTNPNIFTNEVKEYVDEELWLWSYQESTDVIKEFWKETEWQEKTVKEIGDALIELIYIDRAERDNAIWLNIDNEKLTLLEEKLGIKITTLATDIEKYAKTMDTNVESFDFSDKMASVSGQFDKVYGKEKFFVCLKEIRTSFKAKKKEENTEEPTEEEKKEAFMSLTPLELLWKVVAWTEKKKEKQEMPSQVAEEKNEKVLGEEE